MKEYFDKKALQIYKEYYDKFEEFVEEVQVKILDPFCKKYNIKFKHRNYLSYFISSDDVDLDKMSPEELKEKYGKEFITEYEDLQYIIYIEVVDRPVLGYLEQR